MPKSQPTARFERRLVAGALAMFILGGLVVARLVHVQVVQAGPLRAEARNQQERTLDVPATRGAILDRTGEPLVLTLPEDRRSGRAAERVHPRGRLAAQVLAWSERTRADTWRRRRAVA